VYSILAHLVARVTRVMRRPRTMCSRYLVRACDTRQRSAKNFVHDFKIEKIFWRNQLYDTASVRRQKLHLVFTTYTRWKRFKDGRQWSDDDKRGHRQLFTTKMLLCALAHCHARGEYNCPDRGTRVGFAVCLLYRTISFYKRRFESNATVYCASLFTVASSYKVPWIYTVRSGIPLETRVTKRGHTVYTRPIGPVYTRTVNVRLRPAALRYKTGPGRRFRSRLP